MSGVLRLLLFQARRDRVAVPVWILGITLLSFATSAAVATQFGDEAAQVAILTWQQRILRSCSSAACRTEPAWARWCSSRAMRSRQSWPAS